MTLFLFLPVEGCGMLVLVNSKIVEVKFLAASGVLSHRLRILARNYIDDL